MTTVGQSFPMSMYHPEPSGREPGYDAGDGSLRFGGWIWRYDLRPAGPSATEVTLTYDWSAVPGSVRPHIGFPPFPPDHLANSLAHLRDLATGQATEKQA